MLAQTQNDQQPSKKEQCAPSRACCIDLVHLSCIAMGDKHLERDLLQAYAMQAERQLAVLASGDAATVRRAAHMLVGSSRTVGAHIVADRAARLADADGAGATTELCAALNDARAFIANLEK